MWMPVTLFDELEVRRELNRQVAAAGGSEIFAATHKISSDYVVNVLTNQSTPDFAICRALGFMRVTRYVREPKP